MLLLLLAHALATDASTKVPLSMEVSTPSGVHALAWELDPVASGAATASASQRNAAKFCEAFVPSGSDACLPTILDGIMQTEEAFWCTQGAGDALASVQIQIEASAPMEALYLHQSMIDRHGDAPTAVSSLISSYLFAHQITGVSASAIDQISAQLMSQYSATQAAERAAAALVAVELAVGAATVQFDVPATLERSAYGAFAREACAARFEWVGEQKACESHLPLQMLRAIPAPASAAPQPAANVVLELGVNVDGERSSTPPCSRLPPLPSSARHCSRHFSS